MIKQATGETCNQYIANTPKPECQKGHQQLFSILLAKYIRPEAIYNKEMKNKMTAVKTKAWYFISKPYSKINSPPKSVEITPPVVTDKSPVSTKKIF